MEVLSGASVLVIGASETLMHRLEHVLPELRVVGWDQRSAPVAALRAAPLALVYAEASLDTELLSSVASENPAVVVLHGPADDETLVALDAGAAGYLPISIDDRALAAALRGVLAGEAAFTRAALGRWMRERRADNAVPLTGAQLRMLSFIAGGATDKEIARAIGVRPEAVQKRVARTLRRLGARNRAAAVAMIRQGLRTSTQRP